MTNLLLRWAATAVGFWVAVTIVPGLAYNSEKGILGLLFVALVFGLVNAIIRPILILLTCPFVILTLGLLIPLINLAMFALTLQFVPSISSNGFWATLLGAIVVSLVSALLNIFIKEDKE